MMPNPKSLSIPGNNVSSFSHPVTDTMTFQTNILHTLKAVLTDEATTLFALTEQIPLTATTLAERICSCTGKIIWLGMGKSGHIGRKLAATFASLGMVSFFVHPSETLHGDLGMISPNDICIILSKSATGSELTSLIPLLQHQGTHVSLISCRAGALTQKVDLSVVLPFDKEACALNLAPTSSSTLMLAFGDALAVACSMARGFTSKDFARLHPGGALGKSLLSTVSSLMHTKDLPFLSPNSSFQDLLVTITAKKLGLGIVLHPDRSLMGIITDGDLRRACEQGASVFERTAAEIMTVNPLTISPDIHAYTALENMEDAAITSLVVYDNAQVVGLIHLHDLVKAGIKR